MTENEKWLVTGGAGFIGSNFIEHAMDANDFLEVIVLDNFTYAGRRENIPQRFVEQGRLHVHEGDVADSALTSHLVPQCTKIFHFAAETHVTRSLYDSLTFLRTDILGTQAILTACAAMESPPFLVHISTSEVYGTATAPLMNEDHPLNPMSPYAAAKTGADRLVYAFQKSYDLPSVIVRPFNNFGPRQHLEKVLPRFITGALTDQPLRLHGNGEAKRDFIHVKDTCRAIDAILSLPEDLRNHQVFNVASGSDVSVRDLAEAVLGIVKHSQSKIEVIDERPGQVFRHTGDASKLRAATGWEPIETFREALEQTVTWYSNHRDWWESQWLSREIAIRLKDGSLVHH